jgi:hypothetical protein
MIKRLRADGTSRAEVAYLTWTDGAMTKRGDFVRI